MSLEMFAQIPFLILFKCFVRVTAHVKNIYLIRKNFLKKNYVF